MTEPRDTSVLREIIIVRCESVGNCQTVSKDRPSQLVNNIIFRSIFLFFFLRPMTLVPYLFLSHSDVCQPHVLYIVFMFTNVSILGKLVSVMCVILVNNYTLLLSVETQMFYLPTLTLHSEYT